MAMTNAERQKNYRLRRKDEGLKRDWIRKNTRMSASMIAQQKFEKYVSTKLKNEDDLTTWEFWVFLLAQAKSHRLDVSGYASVEYQHDRDKARGAK